MNVPDRYFTEAVVPMLIEAREDAARHDDPAILDEALGALDLMRADAGIAPLARRHAGSF